MASLSALRQSVTNKVNAWWKAFPVFDHNAQDKAFEEIKDLREQIAEQYPEAENPLFTDLIMATPVENT